MIFIDQFFNRIGQASEILESCLDWILYYTLKDYYDGYYHYEYYNIWISQKMRYQFHNNGLAYQYSLIMCIQL